MKWIRRGIATVLVLAALAALAGGGGFVWLHMSLPRTAGTLSVVGLGAQADVVRDDNGIVTIRARSETDAAFALGFSHAQDRLFQMEFMRRLGAGRLSEIVGDSTVETDKLMRILGLYRLAEDQAPRLPSEMQAVLAAYSAGVNAFLQTREGALPLEFQLLWHEPEPWRPADSLVWGRLMAFQLSGNWWDELLRWRLSRKLSPALLESLWPVLPESPTRGQIDTESWHAKSSVALSPPADPSLAAILAAGIHGASNSFAVGGNRSATGKPLLANDPHLGLQTPIQWYLVRIETPERTLVGATAPGVPLVVIGHNGRVAWGLTTTHSDTQDVFIERLARGRPDHYVTPTAELPFETRQEAIAVRGADDIVVTVRATRHGPVISDARSGAWDDKEQVLALAWPGFRSDDATAAAMFRVQRAADAGELIAALRDFHAPQQNFLFADTAGRIGMVAAGRVPVRKALNGGSQMPAPGWTDDHEWIGFLPFESLPQQLDPASGWIATANNKITGDGYPHFLAARWEPPYRYERIAELIRATPLHEPKTFAAIQLDKLSAAARDLMPVLLRYMETAKDLGRPQSLALELMKRWDFQVGRDAPEPLIFSMWLVELNREILAAKLGDLFAAYGPFDLIDVRRLISTDRSPWCDDLSTPFHERCGVPVSKAFEAAVRTLSAHYGEDPDRWRWGDAHRSYLPHPLLDRIPVVRALLKVAIETDGDNFTINRGTPRLERDSATFVHVHGPGLRSVFDLADLDRSRFIIAGGQSGNPLSGHYRSMLTRWRDGETLAIVGEGQEVLTLVPGQGSPP